MKSLIMGGIKSGKSLFAEEYVLRHAQTKPYYLATTEFIDEGMQKRIEVHKQRRSAKFISIEEPLELVRVCKELEHNILIECMSMWLNNMLYHKRDHQEIFDEVNRLLELPQNITFILNDVSKSVVSENALVREFVDLSGILSQMIAKKCDAVYYINAGIGTKLK